jgi:hypothetical protein
VYVPRSARSADRRNTLPGFDVRNTTGRRDRCRVW